MLTGLGSFSLSGVYLQTLKALNHYMRTYPLDVVRTYVGLCLKLPGKLQEGFHMALVFKIVSKLEFLTFSFE